MASKMRPRSAKETVRREAAELRRGAPGKRFIGERASQAREARQAELAEVTRMAGEAHREEIRETPLGAMLVDLAVDWLRFGLSLAFTPFRLLGAVRRWRRAEG